MYGLKISNLSFEKGRKVSAIKEALNEQATVDH